MTTTNEEWSKTTHPGDDLFPVSTLVLLIREDDTVQVEDRYIEEFNFDRSRGEEAVDSFQERFVTVFPVEYIRERLEEEGWTRGDQAA